MDDRLTPLAHLGREVRAASDEAATPGQTVEAARRRALAGWEARRQAAPSPAWRRPALAFAAVAVLAVAALFAFFPRRPAITYVVGPDGAPGQLGGWIAADSAPVPVRFSEGTLLTLSSGARARVTRADADGAAVLLERGSARAKVVHERASTRWRVQAGPFEIAVVGTEFDVAWDPAREVLSLHLIEGRVVVSGPSLGEGRAIAAGERLRVDMQSASTEVGAAGPRGEGERAQAEAPHAAAEPAPPAPATEAPAGAPARGDEAQGAAPAAPAAPGWHALAAEGRHREAMAAVEREGFERVLASASAPALLDLADAARHAGQPQRAHAALMRARSLGARGRAAFLLGKLSADQLGAPGEAISWFEAYLREAPGGGLAEQALGRLIELRRRTGDAPGARQAAEEYLRRYPGGAYAALAEAAIAR